MNDFTSILIALGRAFIKVLTSALVGVGVGLLLAGITISNRPPDVINWRAYNADILIGVGAGLLSGGAMLLILFLVPWMFKRTPEPRFEKAIPVDRPPPERKYVDDRPSDRPPPSPRGEPG